MNINNYKGLILNGNTYDNDQLTDYCKEIVSSKSSSQWQVDICNFILEWINKNDTVKVNTSGSVAEKKQIILKKEYMIQSALNTANALGLSPSDNALLCIPANYIAGKMMVVRAFVTGMNLLTLEPVSDPLLDCEAEIDFAAMVPLQISKILKNKRSKERLRRIKKLIIGGGKLDAKLASELKDFTNPIYETYGMTETCTHIALKRINGENPEKYFRAMEGVEINKDERDCLIIDTPSVTDEKIITNDLVRLHDDQSFEIIGRYDNIINSGGIKINPESIENKISTLIDSDFFIASEPDEILGEKAILIINEAEESNHNISSLMQKLKTKLTSFELPKEVYYCKRFYYTSTSKVQRSKTLESIFSKKH